MPLSIRLLVTLPLGVLVSALAAVAVPPDTPKGNDKTPPRGDLTAAVAQVQVAKGLNVEVWAAEPLLANPVSFAFDEKGRAYVAETTRFGKGVPDTRSHMSWLDEDLANRSITDLLAMYAKHKYTGFEKNDDQLRLVWDSTGRGVADKSTVFAGGFNRPQDGLAAGVLARKGTVYFACIPDLYRLKDTKGTGVADVKESLFTGFGPTVQFLGHDLHGLRMGPDGKLYFSVGDRGFVVTTKEGKTLSYPNQGAVLRCDPDGANLEVVHAGLRNPQELAFDDSGNLFTYENNSDSGDRARWVYVVEGGDSGWRGGFQYGTLYHPPGVPQGNRGPWNTEKLWHTQHDGQPAHVVPPLLHFGNGPAGLTHYPGVGLNDKYRDHFFACDFTANPGGSAIWAVSVKPKGAGFEVAKPEKFVGGMVPTDCEFGPDGAFYWSDWVSGWSPQNKGRIFKLTDPDAMKNPAVAEAKALLAGGFEKKSADELGRLLGHAHQQVRQEAQFELAGRPAADALPVLAGVAKDGPTALAQYHAIWGLGQVGRQNADAARVLATLAASPDAEVRAQAARTIGRLPVTAADAATPAVAKLLTDPEPRVRAFAAVAYGKLARHAWMAPVPTAPGSEAALYAPVFEMLKANNDADPYLRHAAVMALVGISPNPSDLWNAWVESRDKFDTPAVRVGVLLALRRLKSEKAAEFLGDTDPRVVAEAARAVHDDRITAAYPALAALSSKPGLADAVAYRALSANAKLGTSEAAARVATFAARAGEPDHTRAFAVKLLTTWAAPPRRDPITGLIDDLPTRDVRIAADALRANLAGVFRGSDAVRTEKAQASAKLGIKEVGPLMTGLVKDAGRPAGVRVEALQALAALKDPAVKELVAYALASDEPRLRAAGRIIRAQTDPTGVLKELPGLLKDEKVSLAEKQGAFAILGRVKESADADKLLLEWLGSLKAGKVADELKLDVLDAAESRAGTPKLKLHAPLGDAAGRYRKSLSDSKDKLAEWGDALKGGDAEKGKNIFLSNNAVYCQRCHKLDNQGGDVGPPLNGIAALPGKDRRYLLEAVVLPSAHIADGYQTVVLTLVDGRVITGVQRGTQAGKVKLVTADGKELLIPDDEIEARRTGPSAMPDDLHKKLTRRELRDVVEFLSTLTEKPKQ